MKPEKPVWFNKKTEALLGAGLFLLSAVFAYAALPPTNGDPAFFLITCCAVPTFSLSLFVLLNVIDPV